MSVTIEWLDDACTEAIVTRCSGFFRRRYSVARIRLIEPQYLYLEESWRYQPSGDPVDKELRWALIDSRDKALKINRTNRNWSEVDPIPTARVVER